MAVPGQKQRDNYFTRNVQQFGDDFLVQKTAQDLQRDAKNRIFKDMVYGNIDYTVFGKYYLDGRFLNQLIVTAEEELVIHQVYREALQYYDINVPGNIKVRDILMKEINVEAVLNSMVSTLHLVRDTNNIGYLPGFSQSISGHCKKCFSDFY